MEAVGRSSTLAEETAQLKEISSLTYGETLEVIMEETKQPKPYYWQSCRWSEICCLRRLRQCQNEPMNLRSWATSCIDAGRKSTWCVRVGRRLRCL